MNGPDAYAPGTELAGKYRIERLLGHGGMGAVYLALHLGIGRRVAIKVLLPQFAYDTELLSRFRNEARAASAIRHGGIVEMLDEGVGPEGEPFLVMELLEGESLGARLRRTGALELDVAAWIVLQLLDAVGAAHEKGIVHRDLKPDNVFLVVHPRTAVKVLDFGISKFHTDQEPSVTSTSTVLGTPSYMSPEQARSARAAGPKADLYAIGAILYEALTGAPPFVGQSCNEVIARLLTESHRPLRQVRPDLPAPLTALVDQLLAKTPQERPAGAAEVSHRLRTALAAAVATPDLRIALSAAAAPVDEFNDTLPKGSNPPPGGTPGRARRLMLGGLVFGALALATGVGAVIVRGAAVAPVDAGRVADASLPDSGADVGMGIPADAGVEPEDAAAPRPDAARAIPHIATRPKKVAPRPMVAPEPKVAIVGTGAAPDAGKRRGTDIEFINIYAAGDAGR